MRTRVWTAALLGVLGGAGPSLAQPVTAVSDAEAKQAASDLSKRWDDAYNAGDPAAIVALFVPGGVYLTPAGTLLKDHQDMVKALAARQQIGWTKEAIKVVEAHPVGDSISAIVEYTILGTGQNRGKQIGGYAAELLTRSGTEWRLELVAANLTPSRGIPDVTGMAGATMALCPGPC